MRKPPRWIWTLLLLAALPAVMALLVLRQPSAVDRVAHSRSLAAAGAVDDAIAALDAALLELPDSPQLYVERGNLILLLFEWDRALADFDHALTLDPDYADAYFYRGVLFASVPDVTARPNATADFESYLRLASEGEHSDEAKRFIEQLSSAG